jgi:syndecan 4
VCIEGACICNEGYVGDDCSMIDCKFNCSSTEYEVYGYCVHKYPISQCVCNESLKRGGDYCEKLFCLNNCALNGECLEDGSCVCDNLYSGKDCSVFVYPAEFAFIPSKFWLCLLIFINFIL